jgi:hypothetical protein
LIKALEENTSERSNKSIPKILTRQLSPVKPLEGYSKNMKLNLFKGQSSHNYVNPVNELEYKNSFGSDDLSENTSNYDLKLNEFVHKKSLAITMHKRDTLKNLSTLRKVHSNKMQIERKKVFEIAKNMVNSKSSNLQTM